MTAKTQTLVITGSSGFVGQKLANFANSLGFKVIGIDSKNDQNNNWESHGLDISKNNFSNLIPKDSVVIHLASLSTDSACRTDPELAINVNYIGTFNTINSANKAGAKHFIFASFSASVNVIAPKLQFLYRYDLKFVSILKNYEQILGYDGKKNRIPSLGRRRNFPFKRVIGMDGKKLRRLYQYIC
jgi:nucleoside-diphosphate-sugar epimerase